MVRKVNKTAWLDQMVRVRKDALPSGVEDRIRASLTLKQRKFGRDSVSIETFRENSTFLWLPRFYGANLLRRHGFDLVDKRSDGFQFDMDFHGELGAAPFPSGQPKFVEDILGGLRENGLGGFGVADCGMGKTVMGSALSAVLGRATLVLVHRSPLVSQWRESFRRHVRVNGKSPTVGLVREDRCDYGPEWPMSIAMIQSLHSRTYSDDFYRAWGLILIDECLSGDAVVQTGDGPRRMDDPSLASKLVLSYNESSGGLELRKVKRWLPRGIRKTYTVRLRSGAQLRATGRTPFWTPSGWVMLSDLHPGSAVAIANVGAAHGFRPTAVAGPDGLSLDTSVEALASIGMSVWSGSPWTPLSARVGAERPYRYRVGGARIVSMSERGGRLILSAQATTLGVGAPFQIPYSEPCMGRSLGTAPLGGRMREVRIRVLSAHTELRSVNTRSGKPGFLVLSAEGSTRSKTKDMGRFPSFTIQPACLDSIGLPRWFGQDEDVSVLVPSGFDGSTPWGEPCGSWMTEQEETRSSFARTAIRELSAILSLDGFHRSDMARCGLTVARTGTGWSGFYLSRPGGGKMTTGDSPVSQWPTSFDRVEGIEPHKEELVYDLEIEGTHSFVANGVVCHNTHHIPARTWQEAVTQFSARYVVGLTATLRRKDGLQPVFNHALGNVLARLHRDNVQADAQFFGLHFLGGVRDMQSFGSLNRTLVEKRLAVMPGRNEIIAGEIEKAVKAGRRRVMVFSGIREHLVDLYEMLPVEMRRRAGFYVGRRKQEQLDLVAKKNIIFATYGMADEGLDIGDIDSVFLTTPRPDVEQPVGRALRFYVKKMPPIIVDFVDRIESLVGWAERRRTQYIRMGIRLRNNIPAARR